MADIYQANEDGSVIEMSNWGFAGLEDPSKALIGRKLNGSELELFRELKLQHHSDSSIWLEMHPHWPRGNGREILRPLKRPLPTSNQSAQENLGETDGKVKAQGQDQAALHKRFPIRQLTTAMLMQIIEVKCGTRLESLSKMLRHDMEKMAESLLGRDYIILDLNSF